MLKSIDFNSKPILINSILFEFKIIVFITAGFVFEYITKRKKKKKESKKISTSTNENGGRTRPTESEGSA